MVEQKFFKEVSKKTFWAQFPLLLVLLTRLSGFMPNASVVLYFSAIGIYAVYFLLEDVSLDKKVASFLIAIFLSLLFANPDPVFRSWSRYGAFIIIIVVSSPLIKCDCAVRFRRCLYDAVIWCLVVLTIGSFICYFLGINFMNDHYGDYYSEDEYIGSAGHFSGLTGHSMVLGPISAISTIFMTYLGMKKRKKIYPILALICLAVCLMAASRIALAGCIVALMVLLYDYFNSKEILLKTVIVFCVAGFISFPIWGNLTDGVIKKFHRGDGVDSSILDSREYKVLKRAEEFISSPVYGVGFAAQDPSIDQSYNHKTGVVEPGSSIMAVLSMTGLMGFVFFIGICWRTFVNVRCSNSDERSLLLALLVFFLVHSSAEGYILAAGAPLCIIFWLTLSVAYDSYQIDPETSSNRHDL